MISIIMFRYIKCYALQDQSRSGALTGVLGIIRIRRGCGEKIKWPSHEESDLTRRRLW